MIDQSFIRPKKRQPGPPNMLQPLYDNFTAIVHAHDTLLVPIIFAQSGHENEIPYGPMQERHVLHALTRMPELEDAEKIPVPPGYDRETITFLPQYLVLMTMPIVQTLLVHFYHAETHHEIGKIEKTDLWMWPQRMETGGRQSIHVQTRSLYPGERIRFEGISSYRFRRPKYQDKKKSSFEIDSVPRIEMWTRLDLALLVKCEWLPTTRPIRVAMPNKPGFYSVKQPDPPKAPDAAPAPPAPPAPPAAPAPPPALPKTDVPLPTSAQSYPGSALDDFFPPDWELE